MNQLPESQTNNQTAPAIEIIHADPNRGLSTEQVNERVKHGLTNIKVSNTTKTTKQIILSNIFTYFNMIFCVLAAILIFEGSFEQLEFMGVVIINTVISIIQEIRAKKTLEKLTLVSAPLSRVIREGKEVHIPSEELVRDDVIILEAGNQIPADASLLLGEVNVNEALVTGEADEVRKVPGDDLLSGSFIVSGNCHARLTKVGLESFAAKLTLNAKATKKKQQPGMMKSLTLLIKIIGIVIIPLAILMFINQHGDMSNKENIEKTAASVIGMIPEGLYLLTTVALAVSVIRLAKQKTLVHDMKCIETLARVDVICVDKTGTVTEPDMTVQEIVSLNEDTPEDKAAQIRLIRDLVMNMNPDNITMSALKRHFNDQKGYRKAINIKGFSSATKYSAAQFSDGQYLLGAPEFVMRYDFDAIRGIVEQHSALGERVLLFAEYRPQNAGDDIFDQGGLSGIVIPLALVTLKNKIRPEARETFRFFASQGVAIKVISGDNPITVSKAAEEAGIPGCQRYIDASTLTTKEKIEEAILEYTVFGRVTPDQKRVFIRALKKAGHTVAMTGDGVNDVLALKDADCSIAMASGSEAAANVSDLVLLDSNFACMPSVVAEGRRVINNIERSASLFLVKNISSFILTVFTLLLSANYPFRPLQITLLSFSMIGLPAFFLALEPNRELVKGGFLRNVLFRAFPAALTAVILVGWSILFEIAFSIPSDVASTTHFYIYCGVAYLALFHACRPMHLLHRILFGSMGILYILAVVLFPSLFDLVPLTFGAILILVVLLVLSYPLNKIIRMIFDRFCLWKKRFKAFLLTELKKNPQ